MKKSHRKDVIIARIVFAVICVVLILLIAGSVMLVRHFSKEPADEKESQSEITLEDIVTPENTQEETEAVTEETEAEEVNPIVQTVTGVNFRSEPNTNCEVIAVLEQGTQLELLGEENGWAVVEYQGQTGYISVDYLEEVTDEMTE